MALYNHDNVVRRRGRARLSGKSRFKLPADGSFKLRLNAKADPGQVRLRICDEYGAPVAGYDFDDIVPVRGDGLALPVLWKRPDNQKTEVIQPQAPMIRLDFELTDASLFAFEAVPLNK